MPKLIILRGNSGSGKTSTAKALQNILGPDTLLLSQDYIRREMLMTKDGKETSALPLIISLLKYGYEHCEYIILEGILHSEWYKPLFETAVELFGTQIYAYYWDLPFEETLKRHSTRNKRFEFGEEAMRKWWLEKDYIGFIYEHIFDLFVSHEDALKIILNDISYII